MPDEQKRHAAATGIPRRVTDLVEDAAAWMMISACLLLVVAGLVAGVAAHARVVERVRTEAQERTVVSATVLAPAPLVPSESGYQPRVTVDATWTGPDGRLRTGHVPVTQGTPAGTEVTVWLDRNGAVVQPPPTGFEAVAAGTLGGIGVVLVGGSALALVWMTVTRAINAANARRWEREWAEIGAKWTGKY